MEVGGWERLFDEESERSELCLHFAVNGLVVVQLLLSMHTELIRKEQKMPADLERVLGDHSTIAVRVKHIVEVFHV